MTDEPVPLSKTRRKAQMTALQQLGERLVAADPARVAQLDLPEILHTAIEEARRIRTHEARRRQMQYIGRLMRGVDPAPLEARLERWAHGTHAERAVHLSCERWREQLLADPAALDALCAAEKGVDRGRLRTLIARARTEHAEGGRPHAFRELYRVLRQMLDSPAPAAPEAKET